MKADLITRSFDYIMALSQGSSDMQSRLSELKVSGNALKVMERQYTEGMRRGAAVGVTGLVAVVTAHYLIPVADSMPYLFEAHETAAKFVDQGLQAVKFVGYLLFALGSIVVASNFMYRSDVRKPLRDYSRSDTGPVNQGALEERTQEAGNSRERFVYGPNIIDELVLVKNIPRGQIDKKHLN